MRWAQAPCAPVLPHAKASRLLARPVADWPWVEVLHSHAGAQARGVSALLDAGVQGLVVAGTGNGTVHHALLAPLLAAQARGCRVHLTTRCAEGQIVGQAVALQTATRGLNAYKARIELMLDLLD